MTATYRLIHFSPDPFTGIRFPLGAVVVDERGILRFAKAQHVPGIDCLGSRDWAIAAQRLMARLESIDSAEILPRAVGPYAQYSDVLSVPNGVTDAFDWVTKLLTPPPAHAKKPVQPGHPQRASLGLRFFETWKIDQYIRRTFNPVQDGSGWLSEHSAGLHQISHWVPGKSSVLLMEPLVPSRRQFDEDIREIAERFMAYRYALQNSNTGKSGELIAYIMSGGDARRREQAIDTLRHAAHQVIDTDNVQQRSELIATVKRLGRESTPQGAMFDA